MEVEIEWSMRTPIITSHLVDFLRNSNLSVDGKAIKVSWDKCEIESKFYLCNTLTMISLTKYNLKAMIQKVFECQRVLLY